MDKTTLQSITDKIKSVPKMNYHEQPISFTKEENEYLEMMKPIVTYLMYEEIARLNHKIRNHHHLTLSVENGMQMRENGAIAFPSGSDSKHRRMDNK